MFLCLVFTTPALLAIDIPRRYSTSLIILNSLLTRLSLDIVGMWYLVNALQCNYLKSYETNGVMEHDMNAC